MDRNLRRLLEHAGILRRNTPENILFEGEDEDTGDDLFGEDEVDEEEGEDTGEDTGADTEPVREPPEALDAEDVEEFGSPRFKEFDSFLADAFQEAQASAYVGAQEHEAYPGEALPSTPAKDEEEDDKDKEANEALSTRDKELIIEAIFLLTEAGSDEPAAPDVFDMEHFARQVQHLIKHHDTIADIEGSIFNMARQMILNNYGAETENNFVEFLARLDSEMDFTNQFEETIETPVAAGAIAGGGAA